MSATVSLSKDFVYMLAKDCIARIEKEREKCIQKANDQYNSCNWFVRLFRKNPKNDMFFDVHVNDIGFRTHQIAKDIVVSLEFTPDDYVKEVNLSLKDLSSMISWL